MGIRKQIMAVSESRNKKNKTAQNNPTNKKDTAH